MFSVNVNKLKGKIVEMNMTQENIADRMGIDRSTFYRKMKHDGNKFTIYEIHQMVDIIPLSKEEAVEIFLST